MVTVTIMMVRYYVVENFCGCPSVDDDNDDINMMMTMMTMVKRKYHLIESLPVPVIV